MRISVLKLSTLSKNALRRVDSYLINVGQNDCNKITVPVPLRHKSEIRMSKQTLTQMKLKSEKSKTSNPEEACLEFDLFWSFEIVSKFGFRASKFLFLAPLREKCFANVLVNSKFQIYLVRALKTMTFLLLGDHSEESMSACLKPQLPPNLADQAKIHYLLQRDFFFDLAALSASFDH